ncbi:AAA family ATPase [Halomonas alimentaria]|uniref:AAA family ATPase n=1 Tax=Halomonas alimentaria TaxID=147248 RepID=A0A7X4W4W1_9GAMM|nr:AAA family ATPase [Halomonas alimentaria]NAW33496.1 AAA family ATPase [Halomonas alimentaria]
MIIKSLIVENFRSFYGEQEIKFATDRDKNTTLIYAMNGVGKTNLLNALLWCLHGEFSPSFKNRNDILNWEAKRRGRKSYHVTVVFDENDSEFIVKRSGGEIDNFRVFENQEGNLVEIRQDPRLFINSIIPWDMAGYFISDGEGSDLAVDSEGMISVRRSIRDILGFNVAEKASEDLGKIRSEIRADLKKVDKDKELSDIEAKVQLYDERILKTRRSLEDNKGSLEKYQLQIGQVDKKLGGSSSAVVKQLQAERTRMEGERVSLKKELRSEEVKKISLIREYSWVAFAHRLMDEGLEFIDESELKGRIPAPYNIQLVQDILSQSECICGASISPGSEAYERIEKLLGKAADPGLLNRLQRARSSLTSVKTLSGQGRGRLEENFKRCSNIRRRINELDISIEEHSQRIGQIDDKFINDLEKNRKVLEGKIYETTRSIGRLEQKLEEAVTSKKEYQDKASRIVGLSSRAKSIKHKLDIVDQMDEVILTALEEAEDSIHAVLKSKIDGFLERYLRQDYQVKVTSDFKIGLMDRNGFLVPPSGGQGAILSFIYISSLISIARERRDSESSILTPGAIAPLIFDAPFSKLDSKYAPNIAKELPKLVDQLIILMYQDNDKKVDSTLKEEGKLGKVYYFTEETAADQGSKLTQELVIDGEAIPVTVYGARMDKIVITEANIHD